MAYPLWLLIISTKKPEQEKETEVIDGVSLILLSYNGKEYLNEKIKFLIAELSCFKKFELIIIDDNSTDGSKEMLTNIRDTNDIKIICKPVQKGIPHSMNIGVKNAKYDYIIFCDQRQMLSNNLIKQIVEPLKYINVGAVSGRITHRDKNNRYSFIRKHENYIKSIESKTGSLIGVYGPFYALKKQCYAVIPDHIILDDLYLSLRILKTKQIEIREACQIIDENISTLYDYKRTKRYISGFLQILKERTLISDLNCKQIIMLLWHKYLRLLIPFFLFISYICIGINITKGTAYLVMFGILTSLAIISIFAGKFKFQFRLKTLIRINIFYFIALSDIFFTKILLHKKAEVNGLTDINDS
jgi:glycosyltransferase involved in cell wall biosynthesis